MEVMIPSTRERQRRSSPQPRVVSKTRTLGCDGQKHGPQRGPTAGLEPPLTFPTQGALRDPGLWTETPLAFGFS